MTSITPTSSASIPATPRRHWNQFHFGYGIAMGIGIGLCALTVVMLYSAATRSRPRTPAEELPIVTVQAAPPVVKVAKKEIVAPSVPAKNAVARNAPAQSTVVRTVAASKPVATKQASTHTTKSQKKARKTS